MDTLPHEKQIVDYINTIDHLKKQNRNNPLFNSEISKLEQKLELLKEKVYGELSSWERVQICRHPARPRSIDYIKGLCGSFHELHGDRTFSDDPAIIGGIAKIEGMRCVIMGQEKGCDTESRIKRHFGMLNPEGFRKALRLMLLAEKFNLPIISLLDTPGANPLLEAEERGQGRAIALNLMEMSRIKVPILVFVIGEGCSGGALGMGVGDQIYMLEHAYYSVISPESCASILWKDPKRNRDAAAALKLNAENLLLLGVIDQIIKEPLGGAHYDPAVVYREIKKTILNQAKTLSQLPVELLLERRYQKFRKMGKFGGADLKLDIAVEDMAELL